ncbi:MAG: NAD(P)/FAD-dependent oxidoreductase [Gemmobacter sp.]
MSHWDFAIVGGGVAGVTAAAALSEFGSVLLLEAETALGYHASGRSAALYEPQYGKPAVRELSLATGPALRTAGVLSPRGLLMVAGPDLAEAFEADRAAMQLDRLSPDEAVAMVPVLRRAAVALAAHHPDAWDIDTDLWIQTNARRARAQGARIETGARVDTIRRVREGWEIAAGGQTHAVRLLVNAAGAWVGAVAAMAGIEGPQFRPCRRSMARIPAPEGHDVRGWPMLFGPGEDWYAKPDAGALIVSPAEEDPVEPHDAWADDMVLAEGLARYEAMVTAPVTRLIGSWAGLRTFAPDRVLVIGRDPADPDFFWLAGQGGYGFQTSAAAARLCADLIAGRAPELDRATVAALSPARFATAS